MIVGGGPRAEIFRLNFLFPRMFTIEFFFLFRGVAC